MSIVCQKNKFDKKLLDKDALKIITIINKSGFQAYFVGGCVRDLLLGLIPKDFDIVTDARPEEIHKLFKRSRLIGRRFRLVHVLFNARKYIEVATFRSGELQTAKNGMILHDNYYGKIEDDVIRRDFKINALYYDFKNNQIFDYINALEDINNKQINIIGNASERFKQDPVRMIRAVRFQSKLGFDLSQDIDNAISVNSHLLSNISPARLYEECIKLFHNEYGFKVYKQLEKYNLLKHLFAQTKSNDFIKNALLNTSQRIEQNKSVTPVFLFAVFLWQAQNQYFKKIKKTQKSNFLAFEQASEEAIKTQIGQVSIPRWASAKIKDIWLMQENFSDCESKNVSKMLAKRNFRIAYDFFLLRANSINPNLKETADFWTKVQQ